jgi:hypothetical protein
MFTSSRLGLKFMFTSSRLGLMFVFNRIYLSHSCSTALQSCL